MELAPGNQEGSKSLADIHHLKAYANKLTVTMKPYEVEKNAISLVEIKKPTNK